MTASPVGRLLLFLLLAHSLGARAQVAPRQRGIALGLFSEDAGWSYRELLTEIAATGASHVELVIPWYHIYVRSTELGLHPRYSPTEEAVVRTVREARAIGLQVMLFPIVRLATVHGENEWRGTLRPTDPEAWMRSYRDRLLRLAAIAEREQVFALSIGSELSSLDGDEARWRALIAAVRRTYRGHLLYSANWDHYEKVPFFDALDAIGVCGYFPLADREDALGRPISVIELEAAWRLYRSRLEAFALRVAKPLVLSEVGYLSQRAAVAHPWAEGARDPIDLDEQKRAYQALRQAWSDSALEGVYFWNWYGWGGRTSRSYTPRGKPAEEEIKIWFGG